jgi:hypothetical protein
VDRFFLLPVDGVRAEFMVAEADGQRRL